MKDRLVGHYEKEVYPNLQIEKVDPSTKTPLFVKVLLPCKMACLVSNTSLREKLSGPVVLLNSLFCWAGDPFDRREATSSSG